MAFAIIEPPTTVFMADFSYFEKFTDKFRYNGLMSLSDGSDDIFLTDTHGGIRYSCCKPRIFPILNIVRFYGVSLITVFYHCMNVIG